MQKIKAIFKVDKPVIAMIHLQALAGTPKNKFSPAVIIAKALTEAKQYQKAGVDALMIENMHDVPYLKNDVGHEISSTMAIIAYLIKKETQLPLGIQILAGANKAALAVAKAADIDFVRAEGFVFAHVADEGIIEAQAAELLRYRKQIGAEDIAIFTDIKKKHSSHQITADVSLLDTALAAQFFLSDGVIVTGNHTGDFASISDLIQLKEKLNFPVIVGSGLTLDNLKEYYPICDAMIVGSYFKENGYWENAIDENRVMLFMEELKTLRNS